MQLSTPYQNSVEPIASVFRLLTVALAAIAFTLNGQPIDHRLLLVGGAYVAAIGVLRLFSPRLTWPWVVYPMTIVDVGAVSAVISLSPGSSLALWSLYLFPLASTSANGRIPAIVASSLSILSYLGGTWLSTGTVPMLVVWQVTVLVAFTALITVLSHRWIVERQEKRAWQEIAAAARGLVAFRNPDEVAAAVAERTRRLVRADAAWLWSYREDGRTRLEAQTGKTVHDPVVLGELPAALLRKVDHRVVSFEELGQQFSDVVGDVVVLRAEMELIGLLGVAWNKSPRDRTARSQKLRVFAPWAADALAQARVMASYREQLRRGSVLEDAASDLAGTLELDVAREIIVDAAREGLNAAVSLVERSTGRVIVGDVEVTDALVRTMVDEAEDPTAEEAVEPSLARKSKSPLTATIEEGATLVAWRTDPELDALDSAWLAQLAEAGRVALERCAEYDRLQREALRLRLSLEALPAPVVIWDSSGQRVLANQAYVTLGVKDAPRKDARANGGSEHEVSIGSPARIFKAALKSVPDGDCVVQHYREITREREALRAKDELISMAGHELRSPLTSIFGYSQMMARELGVVQQQVDQLNRLIGNFVESAKLEGGQLSLNRQVIDLGHLARLGAERFRGAHEGRGLTLNLSDTLPIEGDAVRLGQVLDNLLSNAVKYSTADQEIVLSVAMDQGLVILTVQDQGVGIAREHLPFIFNRFYRVPNVDTEHIKGSGLGLSIVRDIVTAHGGRVWVESEGRGLGSTFGVSFTPLVANRDSLPFRDRRAS